MKVVVVTPAHNEADYIEMTIKSMIDQTHQPIEWIIVNDGSTDNTADIVEEYSALHPWIKLINNNNKKEDRSGGSKVVRAFYKGYNEISSEEYDVIVKLDADLTLPVNYFENIVACFQSNPLIGLCGGFCEIPENGTWIKEPQSSHHVRGAFKSYRARCFEQIGGFKETWNWDGIDGMKTMQLGWEIKVLDLPVKHHRPTSAAYNPVKHAYKSGVEAYKTGNDIGLVLLRTLIRLPKAPRLIGGIQYLKGYLQAWLKREPKVVDPELGKFIRKFTYSRILGLNK